jgi:voltage-gated potassium channel
VASVIGGSLALLSDWFIWAAFALEYMIRLALTEQRAQFIRQQRADLLIIVLPFLRPLRVDQRL